MPHVVAYNLNSADFDHIGQIECFITAAVVAISELKLKDDDLSFSFPRDPSVTSDKVPVIIIVELLFDKPERTHEVRQLAAKRIADAVSLAIDWRKHAGIEVAVKRFDPKKDGFFALPEK